MTSDSDTESDSGVSAQEDETSCFAFQTRAIDNPNESDDLLTSHNTADVIQAMETLQSLDLENTETVSRTVQYFSLL